MQAGNINNWLVSLYVAQISWTFHVGWLSTFSWGFHLAGLAGKFLRELTSFLGGDAWSKCHARSLFWILYIYIYALHESAHMQYTSHTCHMRFYIYEKPRLGMLCRSCVWWSFLLGKEMCGEPVGPAQHLRLGLMLPTMLLLMVNKMPLTSYQVQEWGTPLSWKLLAAFLTFECFVWIWFSWTLKDVCSTCTQSFERCLLEVGYSFDSMLQGRRLYNNLGYGVF